MKKFVALAALSLILAAACTGQSDPEPDEASSPSVVPSVSSSPSVEPSPSPSPEPSPSPSVFESFPPAAPDASEEELAIVDGLRAYYNTFDKFAADPTLTDLTETQHVTSGEAMNFILAELQALRENGHIAVGERAFRDLTIREVPGSGGARMAEVTYCNDRSRVRVLDAQTREDTGHRPVPFVRGTATLEEGADGIWRVSKLRTASVESCANS